jgi:hypothetical protein
MSDAALLLVDTSRLVEVLNALLRSELSAADTYQLVIDKLGSDAGCELADGLNSHRQRSEILAAHVRELGGQPAEEGEIWSAFAHLVSSRMAPHSRLAMLETLVVGECRTVQHYREATKVLDTDSLALCDLALIPEQFRIQRVIGELRHREAWCRAG